MSKDPSLLSGQLGRRVQDGGLSTDFMIKLHMTSVTLYCLTEKKKKEKKDKQPTKTKSINIPPPQKKKGHENVNYHIVIAEIRNKIRQATGRNE